MIYGVVVVVIIVAAIVLVLSNSSSGSQTALIAFDNQPVNATQISAMESIASNMTLANKVGAGFMTSYPKNISGQNVTMVGGKPAVIYVGADFCPFCAITRWGFIIALMRFGTFSKLNYMTSSSSSTEPFRTVPTFTFYNSSYSSTLISFVPAEIETNTYQPLQTLNALQNAAASTYDTGGSIPFIDFGNQSVQIGVPQSVSPGYLKNLNWGQIIALMQQSNSTVSQALMGQANVFTAQICRMDGYQPSSVCSQPFVKEILS
jgi:hypothetical protein